MPAPCHFLRKAKMASERYYFTGRPCTRGHIANRFVSTRQCVECCGNREKARTREERRAEYEKTGRLSYIRRRLAEPWNDVIKNARLRAKKHGFQFDLTMDWAQERWTGHCELSGKPFDIAYTGLKGCRPFSPSIDRINPLKGYTQDNCWIILFAYNAAKGQGTLKELFEILNVSPTHKREAA